MQAAKHSQSAQECYEGEPGKDIDMSTDAAHRFLREGQTYSGLASNYCHAKADKESIARLALPKAKSESTGKVAEPPQVEGYTNVFSEFFGSAYQSAIQRPVDSIKQLTGLKVEEAPEVQLKGAMKVSNVIGRATGQILDFLVLNKVAGRALKEAVSASGEASVAARTLAEGTVPRAAATSATVGFVNGALLTPVKENEGLSRRLTNGLVDAGSFTAMGVTGAKFAGSFGDTLLGRAKLGTLSGVAGGVVDSTLDPVSRGRLPSLEEAAVNTASWAAGSVIAGEALRTAVNGLILVGKEIKSQVQPAGETAEKIKLIDATTNSGKIRAGRDRWIGAGSSVQRGAVLFDVADVPHANAEVSNAQGFQDRTADSVPWNRTAPVIQRFNGFEGQTDADVVVVGGGVVGLQTAHELGSHGMKTIVLDKGLVGSGTSRFMGAMGTYAEDSGFGGILQAHGEEGFARRLQALLESRASVQQLAQRYGADWRDVHSYNVSYDANDPALKEEVDLLHRFGDMAPRFVTGQDAARIFAPARSIAIFPNEGNLNPYKLALGLANSGKFAVYENSPVLGIAVGAPGDGVDVYSSGGTIHARKVVFATNGPAPMFSDLNQHLVPVQCFATVADIGQKLPGNFFDTDTTAFTYWRQFGLKPFGPTETLIGGSARFLNKEKAAPDSPLLNARVAELFSGASARDPITALIFTAYSDGIPVAGPHSKYPDVWSATGAGGTGLVNGNWIARTIRQQLMGGSDENLISPDRFQSPTN